jgi:hypothetical protein
MEAFVDKPKMFYLLQVEFHPNHRNMTIIAGELGLRIRHRYAGHYDLDGHLLGVETFSHPLFQV